MRSNALRKSNKTTLITAEFPSEQTCQLWIMLTSACVVHDLGIVPYCLLSIFFKHGGYHKVMNNIIFCNLRKDRCKRDRAKVLVDVLDRSLFGDRDDICLFPR